MSNGALSKLGPFLASLLQRHKHRYQQGNGHSFHNPRKRVAVRLTDTRARKRKPEDCRGLPSRGDGAGGQRLEGEGRRGGEADARSQCFDPGSISLWLMNGGVSHSGELLTFLEAPTPHQSVRLISLESTAQTIGFCGVTERGGYTLPAIRDMEGQTDPFQKESFDFQRDVWWMRGGEVPRRWLPHEFLSTSPAVCLERGGGGDMWDTHTNRGTHQFSPILTFLVPTCCPLN